MNIITQPFSTANNGVQQKDERNTYSYFTSCCETMSIDSEGVDAAPPTMASPEDVRALPLFDISLALLLYSRCAETIRISRVLGRF
jgi:hypothetical protein